MIKPHWIPGVCLNRKLSKNDQRIMVFYLTMGGAIGGLHMMSSKHDFANYDRFVPNFGMDYKTIKRVFVPNLKSFGPMKTELRAKEVREFLMTSLQTMNILSYFPFSDLITDCIWIERRKAILSSESLCSFAIFFY